MRQIIFELCAETLQSCVIAKDSGADRIELCTALDLGGLTPSHGLIRESVLRSGLPVHVLLRPRAGGFVYTHAEIELMRDDLLHARSLGASGFIIGMLHPDRTVDIERTRSLVALAAPLEVTFHRAFDTTQSLDEALEDVIATGCRRLLTSGGEQDVDAGANRLASLVQQAAGRIEIAVGGGLRLTNASRVARVTGATHFHGSLRNTEASHLAPLQARPLDKFASENTVRKEINPADVRAMLRNLRET
jgi:copper homeostasis protein